MAKVDWLKSCSCDYGCPCDFNARPTQGWCKGFLGMQVTEGHFGSVNLDGVGFFATVDFPGPLHEGNGTLQPIIDARATPEQRDALLQIMSGKHSEEGTLFHIVSLIVAKMLDPVFARIELRFDYAKRRAKLSIPGVLDCEIEPIKNPLTGAERFEHREGEVAHGTITSKGGIRFDVPKGHATLAHVEQTPAGLAA
jgi:hypothetical protein